jgi:hypothetical protein
VDVVYDPADPDVVEVVLADGTVLRSEISLPSGSVQKPMSGPARRAKFDQCLEPYKTAAQRDDLWLLLSRAEHQDNLLARLGL